MQLTDEQIKRYSHHIINKDIGGEGQKRLLASKVLVVGVGGLGSPALLYLAAAGVGTIGIADMDVVEISNLQRQIIHSATDIGKKKIRSAAETIRALNDDVRVIEHDERVDATNAKGIFAAYDFIIDGSDNFPTKFLINDTCVKMGIAYSHAGVAGFKGQTFTFMPGEACLRCLFSNPPPDNCTIDCKGVGILGAAAGIVGSIQAAEAIKYILGKEGLLKSRVLYIDALSMNFNEIRFNRDPSCQVCRDI